MVSLILLIAASILDEETGSAVVEEALLAQKSVCLQVDMCRIEQVIRNLITNAVRTCDCDCDTVRVWWLKLWL